MSSIKELESQLLKAQERCQRLTGTLSFDSPKAKMEEYHQAHLECLRLERELASAKGEPYAVPLDFPVRWSTGAPLPHLVMNDYRVLLSFYVREPDPDWDGTYVTIKDPNDNRKESLALVEFHHSTSAKLGAPNDEVLHGHPLWGKGLDSYTAQIVKNSTWIQSLEAIDRVHHYYHPDRWRVLNHYVLWFHDTTFECVAQSFSVELYRESMSEMHARMTQRLVS